jgi:peroxiredoxin (alkyl hydroperoxide reductase subunit C)
MTTTTTLEIGQVAPDFKLKGPGAQPVTLSEYNGQKHVVLVFFPFAFSGPCSHQLPEVQAAVPQIEAHDGVVMGISVDSHFANEAFQKQLGLSFPLLSDFKREASRAYGVLIEPGNFSGRATFLIDKQGKVAHKEVSESPGDIDSIPSIDQVVRLLKTLK